MITLLRKFKPYPKNDDNCYLVNVPEHTLLKCYGEIGEYCKSIGINKDDVRFKIRNEYMVHVSNETYEDYFKDCILVKESIRKGLKTEGEAVKDIGESYFGSLADYMTQVDDMHDKFLVDVKNFRDSLMPDFEDFTEEKLVTLLEDILKKKVNIEDKISSLNSTSRKVFIIFLVRELTTLQEKNSQLTLQSIGTKN